MLLRGRLGKILLGKRITLRQIFPTMPDGIDPTLTSQALSLNNQESQARDSIPHLVEHGTYMDSTDSSDSYWNDWNDSDYDIYTSSDEESGNSSNRDQEPSGSTEGAKKADPVSKDEGPTEVVGTEQVGSEVTDHVDGADPRVGTDEVDISDRDGESAHEEHDNNYDGPNILSQEGYALGDTSNTDHKRSGPMPTSESVNTDMKEEPCVPDHDIGTADASSQKGDGARKMAVKIMDEELVKLHPDDIHVPTTGTASAFVDSPTCLGSPRSFLTWIEFKCIKSSQAFHLRVPHGRYG